MINFDWIDRILDCGSNSCRYRDKTFKRQRTNGMCRCFRDIDANKRIFIERLFSTLVVIRDDNKNRPSKD